MEEKSAVGKVGCVLPPGLRLSIFAQPANYERTFPSGVPKYRGALGHNNVRAQNKIKLLAFLLNFLPVLSEFVHI